MNFLMNFWEILSTSATVDFGLTDSIYDRSLGKVLCPTLRKQEP